MTIQGLWSIIVGVLGAIGILAAGAGAIYALISYTGKYKAWRKKREDKDKAQDKLVELLKSENLVTKDQCALSAQRMLEVDKRLLVVAQDLEALSKSQNITRKHNERQDKQIRASLEEREILMEATSAVLTSLIDGKANGKAHEARDRICAYQNKMSHQFEAGKESIDEHS